MLGASQPGREIEIEKGEGRKEGRKEEERIRSKQMDSYTSQRIKHISIHAT